MILFGYLDLLVWLRLIWIPYMFSWVAWLWSLSGGLRIFTSVCCYACVWMNVTRVRCLNVLFGKWWLFGWNFDCYAWCGGVYFAGNLLVPCGTRLKVFVNMRFSTSPRDPRMTLSPIGNIGKGFSSPVWNSGRGLVWVLNSLANVKQYGEKRCFALLPARCWVYC